MTTWKSYIDKYYESGSALREVLIRHSAQVAAKAKEIAKRKSLDLPVDQIEDAAMLHDIGIFMTHAPSILCNGTQPYIMHGILGADLLRQDGAPEWAARVAERHTGAGLSVDDIVSQSLPLPQKDYLPETLLEKLICYADKFFSKSGDMAEKSIDDVRRQMTKFGDSTMARFEQLHQMFS